MCAWQVLPRAAKHVAEDQSNDQSMDTTYVSNYAEDGLACRLHDSEEACERVDPARSFLFDLELPSHDALANTFSGEQPESLPVPISNKLEELFGSEETCDWKEHHPALGCFAEPYTSTLDQTIENERQDKIETLDQEQTLQLSTLRVQARTIVNRPAKNHTLSSVQSKKKFNLFALMTLCTLSLIVEIALASENSIAPASNAQASTNNLVIKPSEARQHRMTVSTPFSAPAKSAAASGLIKPVASSESQAPVSTGAIITLEDLKAYAATAKQQDDAELVFQPVVQPVMPVVPTETTDNLNVETMLDDHELSTMGEAIPTENDVVQTLPEENHHVVEVWTGSARTTNVTPKF